MSRDAVKTQPLFVPLRRQYWIAFRDGRKRTEYRLYRGQWTTQSVWQGRKVILSLGYSGDRLFGVVTRVRTLRARDVPGIELVYPDCSPSDPVLAFTVRLVNRF